MLGCKWFLILAFIIGAGACAEHPDDFAGEFDDTPADSAGDFLDEDSDETDPEREQVGDTGDESCADSGICCQGTEKVELTWDLAEITPPMEREYAAMASGDMAFIYTTVEKQGWAELDFELPCDGDWFVWAKGWVPSPLSLQNGPPHTFFVGLDDIDSVEWKLEPTAFLERPKWRWNFLNINGNVTFPINRGPHQLVVSGGQSGGEGYNPAFGTVVFSTDPNYQPTSI